MSNISDYVRRKLGNVSDAAIEAALPSAQEKLERIIAREGDANGERLKPYYIAQLLVEKIQEAAAEKYYREAHGVKTKKIRENRKWKKSLL